MITTDELIAEISSTVSKKKIIDLSRIVKDQKFALYDLIGLTFHQDKDLAFRSAWILENVYMNDPVSYQSHVEYIVSRIKEVKHASCQRHYAKIIACITGLNASLSIRNQLNLIDLQPVIEQCFDWMIDPKTKIAVKVFSSRALFNLKERYPWVREELSSQLQFMMRDGSPGIKSTGKKLLSKL